MNPKEINQIVEALLFASPEPLTQVQLNSVFEMDLDDNDSLNLEIIVDELNQLYIKNDNAFTIIKVAGG